MARQRSTGGFFENSRGQAVRVDQSAHFLTQSGAPRPVAERRIVYCRARGYKNGYRQGRPKRTEADEIEQQGRGGERVFWRSGTQPDCGGQTRKWPKALSKPVPSATRPPLQRAGKFSSYRGLRNPSARLSPYHKFGTGTETGTQFPVSGTTDTRPEQLCRGRRFRVRASHETAGHPRGILREIALRRVLEIPECHGHRSVAHEFRDARQGHPRARTVNPECVTEIVNPNVVQLGSGAGRPEHPLRSLVAIERSGEDRISWPCRVAEPMPGEQFSQRLGNRHIANTGSCLNLTAAANHDAALREPKVGARQPLRLTHSETGERQRRKEGPPSVGTARWS